MTKTLVILDDDADSEGSKDSVDVVDVCVDVQATRLGTK